MSQRSFTSRDFLLFEFDPKQKGFIPKNEAFCFLEVERIELSSLANYELTTTCLAF